MLFKRNRAGSAPQKSALPDNPFTAARNEWDDRYDRLSTSRRNYQVLAFVLLTLDVGLTTALFYLSTTSRITPYIVEVDKHGDAVAFGPAEQLQNPDERIIRRELENFIRDLRTVHAPGNEPLQQQALARLDAHVRPPAAGRVAAWFKEHNPFAPDRVAVSVQVTSILRLEKDLWQVEWSETPYARDGVPKKPQLWQAVLSIHFDPPTSSESIHLNTFGLYVRHIDWSHVVPTSKEKL